MAGDVKWNVQHEGVQDKLSGWTLHIWTQGGFVVALILIRSVHPALLQVFTPQHEVMCQELKDLHEIINWCSHVHSVNSPLPYSHCLFILLHPINKSGPAPLQWNPYQQLSSVSHVKVAIHQSWHSQKNWLKPGSQHVHHIDIPVHCEHKILSECTARSVLKNFFCNLIRTVRIEPSSIFMQHTVCVGMCMSCVHCEQGLKLTNHKYKPLSTK